MLLVASLIALFVGPFLFKLTRNNANWLDLLDGFIFVVIGGLVVFHILPDAIAEIGVICLLFTLLGLLGPSLAETLFHKAARMTHNVTLLLGVSGLVLHSMTDGLALIDNPDESQLSLIIAIVLHRLPVGLTVWWLLRPHFGRGIATAVLLLMAAGTLAGAEFGSHWLPTLGTTTTLLLQSFIAGSVLHVVFHRPYAEHQHHHHAPATTNHFDGLGSLIGVITLLAILISGEAFHGHEESHGGHEQLALLWQLALILSPFLLLAYALSSLTSFFFPGSHPTALHDRPQSGLQTVRGALLGLPLPFCIPDATKAYQLLRQQGAAAPMALAFLVAAPIIGFESLLVSLPLLGWPMTLVRLIAAVLVIMVLAVLLSPVDRGRTNVRPTGTTANCPPAATRLATRLPTPAGSHRPLADCRTDPRRLIDLRHPPGTTHGSHLDHPVGLTIATLRHRADTAGGSHAGQRLVTGLGIDPDAAGSEHQH